MDANWSWFAWTLGLWMGCLAGMLLAGILHPTDADSDVDEGLR